MPSGLPAPTSCRATRCIKTRAINISGSATTSGSFGRAEPKYGIVTERFELKNKNIDDNNTVLLIHSNTENDSVVFSGSMGDSSLSNHSMSFSGSVKHTSSFAQFGRTSLYFGGSGSLEVSGSGTENRDLEFGNNEFTIEYWVRQDDAQTAKTVFRKPGSYVLENETDVNNIIFKSPILLYLCAISGTIPA